MGSVRRVSTAEPSGTLLERVRKLLAKAEGDGVTPAEAEALTEKAADADGHGTASTGRCWPRRGRTPTARTTASSTCRTRGPTSGRTCWPGWSTAMRCQCVLLPARSGKRVHVFGYQSDLERAEMLYTSLLVQMAHGLAVAAVPRRRGAFGPGGGAGCWGTRPP